MKILFVSYDLGIGGIQKSLVNLLKKMTKENPEYQIDLLLFSKEGEYLNELPSQINVLSVENKALELSVKSYAAIKEHRSKRDRFKKVSAFLSIKLFGHEKYYAKIIGSKKTHMEYDLAVSYSHDNYSAKFLKGANLFVLNRVEAKEKHAYLHADVSKETVDFVHMEKIYSQFDKVFTVSKACQDILIGKIPSLKDRVSYKHNVFDEDELKVLSQEYIPFDKQEDITYFSTVTRLSFAKGIDRILSITQKLVERKINNFKWFVVGEGQGEYVSSFLNAVVKEKGLDSHLTFVGNKANPFPYVKHSDLFVFPSRFESFAMVVVEAMILGVPVVTCDYSAAREVLLGTDNIIVPNEEGDLFDYLSKKLTNA